MRRILLIFFFLSLLILTNFYIWGKAEGPTYAKGGAGNLQEIQFDMDGYEITLTSSFLPRQQMILPDSGAPNQAANFLHLSPNFQEIKIITIPFGYAIGTEILPTTGKGKTNYYINLLNNFRKNQGGEPKIGPIATLFGVEISGIASLLDLYVNVNEKSTVQIVEWVTEFEDRLWIIRASQEVTDTTPQSRLFQSSLFEEQLEGFVLSVTRKGNPIADHIDNQRSDPDKGGAPKLISNDLPAPSWWGGYICDLVTYYDQTEEIAYPLGGSYRGVLACGPRPWADGGPHAVVQFFPGAWGELEWECVELSMRFMYLAYGINPYQANGNQVVTNYDGDRLIKINNGTPGISPQPDDIISTGVTSTYGHTAIVMENNVDTQGNGTIQVLEQNSSETGIRSYNVINWFVQSTDTVIGWLHDPTSSNLLLTYFPLSFR
jgi:hypothetical protein